MSRFLIVGDKGAPAFVFAHGAGAAMDSDFMADISLKLADSGLRVIRFEFPYMQQQRLTGKRRPPDRQPKLVDHYREVLESIAEDKVAIGGKSMGGRMASMLAVEYEVAGVAVLGYPFHPQGKPEKLRVEHLAEFKTPMLICQGDRDVMGSKAEVANYRLSKNIRVQWFADGDHDLKPRKASGESHQEHIDRAVYEISSFVKVVCA